MRKSVHPGNLTNLFSSDIEFTKDPLNPLNSTGSTAQRPICSSRRAYIPAAVPEVCSF